MGKPCVLETDGLESKIYVEIIRMKVCLWSSKKDLEGST